MKKWMALGWMMCLPVMGLAQTGNKTGGAPANRPMDLEILGYGIDVHGFVEAAYQSQYIWRGFDVFRDRGAVQLTAGMQFADTGFGVEIQGHRANGSGFEEKERWDYNPYYRNSLFKGEPIQTDFQVGWVYYNYPQNRAKEWDLQELNASFSMPEVTTIKGLVPRIVLVKMWPAHGSSPNLGSNASGFIYIGQLDYTFAVPGLLSTMPEQEITLHSELVFNDGVSPRNTVVDSDWSDAVLGVSTNFDLGYGIKLTPALYFQKTMDKSVNPDDSEVWCTICGKFAF
jgi:hypothetical protein